jgi:cell division protein FtsQ
MGVAMIEPAIGHVPAERGPAERGPAERGPAERGPAGKRALKKKAAGKVAAAGRSPAGRAARGRGATRTVHAAERPHRTHAWLNRILILIGAGVVLAAALQAWVTLRAIPVERITVTGELEHTRTEAVQEMVQPALVGGFLRADLQRIREQLEALPWIFEATVRRRWPNALEIHVVEQLPIARWGEEAFLNHEGQLFRSDSGRQRQALPMLRGPEGSARALTATYQRMVDILAPVGLAVEQLAMDGRGQVEAVLDNGTRLLLGSADFLERMHRFVALYRARLAARAQAVERVDMRYERGAAVAFREPPLVAGS